MSLKLGIGVIDVPEPYGDPPKSTYEVGMDLEKRYGIFTMFYNFREKEISELIAKDAAIGLEMMLKGESVDIASVFAVSSEEITDKMHDFITQREVENIASTYGEQGIPTQAAIDGKSFRFDKGFTAKRQVKGLKGTGTAFTKRNQKREAVARPSFMYSGVFEASLKAEIK